MEDVFSDGFTLLRKNYLGCAQTLVLIFFFRALQNSGGGIDLLASMQYGTGWGKGVVLVAKSRVAETFGRNDRRYL